MQLPHEVGFENERLLITPEDCRFEMEPSDLEVSPQRFYKRFYKEFGYEPPRPAILAMSIGELRRLDLADLDQNVQITSAGERATDPSLQQHFRFDPRSRDHRDIFFRRNRATLFIHRAAQWSVDEDCMRHYWLTWMRRGKDRDETFLKVGLSACQIHVFVEEGECRLIWWERETRAASENLLWDAFDPFCDRMQDLTYGDAPTTIADAWYGFMKSSIDSLIKIDALAEDPSIHHYQNPDWEHIFYQNGSRNRSDSLLAINNHPRSGYWIREAGEFMAVQVG
jgi:hypothetical protein